MIERTRSGIPHCSACLMGEGEALPAIYPPEQLAKTTRAQPQNAH
jgi:hypothetical protein